MNRIVTLLIGLALSFSLSAQQVRFLKGLPEMPLGNGISYAFGKSSAIPLGNRFVFIAQDRFDNYEMWITDSTPEGTFKLKDLNENDPSYPTSFAVLNNRIIFAATDVNIGRELWITDGTVRGTKLLKDIRSGLESSYPLRLTSLGDKVVFIADDGVHGGELWETDGSTEGTNLVMDINPLGNCYSQTGITASDKPFENINGKIYFTGYVNKVDTGVQGSLIQSDGTPSGTQVLVEDVNVSYDYSLSLKEIKNHKILFTITTSNFNSELLITDGTKVGTKLLKNLPTPIGSSSTQMTVVDSVVYFVARNGFGVERLWVSNGTFEGTHEVASFSHSNPTHLRACNGKIFLYANDGQGPLVLVSDGVITRVISNTISEQSGDQNSVLNNKFLYAIATYDGPTTIWSSDGNQEVMLHQFDYPSYAYGFFVCNNRVFFTARTEDLGAELWCSDGTPENTTLFKDLNPGKPWSSPQLVYSDSTQFLFTAQTDLGDEYWISNGTQAGTKSVGDINKGMYTDAYLEFGLLKGVFENNLLARDDSAHFYLWNKDTEISSLIFTLPENYYAKLILPTTNNIYFVTEEANINRVWVYNGLTKIVTKIFEAPFLPALYSINNKLLFFALTSTEEPWKLYVSDGGVPTVLKDSEYNGLFTWPDSQTSDKFYFELRNWNGPSHLWSTDGTSGGTHEVLELPENSTFVQTIGQELLFMTKTLTKTELWKTSEASGFIETLSLLSNDNWSISNSNFKSIQLRGKFYLFFYDALSSSTRMYETDGTEVGTSLITQTQGLSSLYYAVVSNETVFYNNQSTEFGRELWKSDGTAVGTKMVKDISQGSTSSMYDSPMALLNDKIIFSARAEEGFGDPISTQSKIWVTEGEEETTKLLSDNGSEPLRGSNKMLTLSDRVYLNTIGYQNQGMFEIYNESSGIQVLFNETKVNRNAQVEWSYTPVNQELTKFLTITNTGDQPLVMASLNFKNSEFSLDENISGTTILPNKSKVYTVRFNSTVSGIFLSDVTLTSNVKRDPVFNFRLRAVATASSSIILLSVEDRDEFCANDVKMFKVESSNPGKTPIYDWYAGDQLVASGTTSILAVPNLIMDTNLRVKLTPSEDAASTQQSISSNILGLIVHPVVETLVSITSDVNEFPIESGTLITFSSIVTNGGTDPNFQWLINDIVIDGATLSSFTTSSLEDGDKISLVVYPNVQCPFQNSVLSNIINSSIIITDIDEADFNKKVLLYPNPANEEVFINSPQPIDNIQIMDLSGKIIKHYGAVTILNTSDLVNGLYILKIAVASQLIIQKLVIQH